MTITGPRTSSNRADRQQQRRGRPGWHWLRRATLVAISLLLLAAVTGVGMWVLTPSVADAAHRVQARNAAHGAAYPGSPSPAKVVDALTATEDASFFSNHGLDVKGLVRGAYGTVTGASDAGGATLEQQLAKILYTGGRSGPAQVAEQLALAVKLDQHYSKTTILRLYLSTVYFGDGAYGLDQAAEHYFSRTPAELDWPQASLLAGLVQAPSAYDPVTHLALAKKRQQHVLDRLVATGHLTQAQAQSVAAAPLGLTTSP